MGLTTTLLTLAGQGACVALAAIPYRKEEHRKTQLAGVLQKQKNGSPSTDAANLAGNSPTSSTKTQQTLLMKDGRHTRRWALRLPWWLISIGALLFTVGLLLRLNQLETHSTASSPLWAAAATTCLSYLMWMTAVVVLRLQRNQDHVGALDWIIACLGLGLLAFITLHQLLPTAVNTLLPPEGLNGLYLFGDLVIGLFILNAARTVHRHSVSMWLFMLTVFFLFLGNLALTLAAAETPLVSLPPSWPPFLQAPTTLIGLCYLLAASCAIAGALHPSIAVISKCQPSAPDYAWSARRMAGLLPCLLSPFLALFIEGTRQSPMLLSAVSFSGVGMILALLIRATGSVRAYARTEHIFRHQARHDALTGLANRRLLEEHISDLLPRQRSTNHEQNNPGVRADDSASPQVARDLAKTVDTPVPVDTPAEDAQQAMSGARSTTPTLWVLFLDLDGFKSVNDCWGHDVGDELLIDVAGRLNDCLNEATIISRIGGDEFVVAVRASHTSGPQLARRILNAFAAPFRLSSGEVTISPSIGVAQGERHTSAQELLREADTAMYRAKATGRNRWVLYDHRQREEELHLQNIDQDLRKAIVNGTVRVEYQPLVELGTDRPSADQPTARVVGVEGLVRWYHPALGQMDAERFLPLAEENSTGLELGRWSVTTALTHLASWRAADMVEPNFAVRVNLTTRQLCDPQLLPTLNAALQRSNVPANCLHIEVSPSTALGQPHRVTHALHQLHGLGVHLSLDVAFEVENVGQYATAVTCLQHNVFNSVKIPPDALTHRVGVRSGEQMVRAMVALCHQLDVTVIATAVETQDYENYVRQLGITYAQGWRYVADFSALGHRSPATTHHPSEDPSEDLPLTRTQPSQAQPASHH